MGTTGGGLTLRHEVPTPALILDLDAFERVIAAAVRVGGTSAVSPPEPAPPGVPR